MFCEFCSSSALSCIFEFLWVVVGGGGCSQRLLCLNPTTVMVVLLLGLWLLLGCDNYQANQEVHKKSQNCVEAAIAFVCTRCKRQLLFAILQLITFVCITAFDNFFSYHNCPLFCAIFQLLMFLLHIAFEIYCMSGCI